MKTRCETRWGWPYLTRCTQEGKRLQSYFFMPLWVESQGKGMVVVSVRLQSACEARERRVARVTGGSPRVGSAREMPVESRGRHLRIVNADLGIRDTTAVPALRVRLVLNNAVALGGTARHGDGGSLPCLCERATNEKTPGFCSESKPTHTCKRALFYRSPLANSCNIFEFRSREHFCQTRSLANIGFYLRRAGLSARFCDARLARACGFSIGALRSVVRAPSKPFDARARTSSR